MTVTQENPLLEGLQVRRTPDPCAFVIFGASGDLTQRKLIPAIYSLAYRRLLPQKFSVVGVARSEMSDDEFRTAMEAAVKEFARDPFRPDVWEPLAEGMRYISTDFVDEAALDAVAASMSELDEERGTEGNRLYYFAVPPSAIEMLVRQLGKRRKATGWTRLVIEKPFGHDLDSARKLTNLLQRYFTEDEIFRIDHYLGKETVQNVLALRFANGIFEPIWNRQFIDHVQITVAETMGIERRAGYYEQAGAIRDIFQNHLLQLRRADGDGASDRLHGGAGTEREGEGAAFAAHAGPEVGRARAVRARLHRGRRSSGLPRGGGRRPQLDDRHVCRREALRRQLALGRHAVLRAHGEAARAAGDDDRDPLQARAAPAVRGVGDRGPSAERARHPRPAGRGRVARDRREGSRRRDDDPQRAHGLPLRRRVPDRACPRRTSG